MSANAVIITRAQMDELLAPHGFVTISLPNTQELVYAKAYTFISARVNPIKLSLRVYSSIVKETSRGIGEDAIRVSVWTKETINNETRIYMLGNSKRVHRVEHWRGNLSKRIANWETMLEPYCPICGAPMTIRKPKNEQHWQSFYGCILYRINGCKGSILA